VSVLSKIHFLTLLFCYAERCFDACTVADPDFWNGGEKVEG